MATVETPRAGGDSSELAEFGYKQELDRSLGSFSSFAAGFSYISILTGVFELFGFGFLNAWFSPQGLQGHCALPNSPVSSRSPDRSISGPSGSVATSSPG